MGIHIQIYRADGYTEHPSWDAMRYAGDDYIPFALGPDPEIFSAPGWGAAVNRPRSVNAFYNEMMRSFPENESRWVELREILLEQPLWWIYASR